MNRTEELIIRAVAEGRCTKGTVLLAKRYIDRHERPTPAPRAAAPAKKLGGAVEHHARTRRAEEVELEDVKRDVWNEALARSWRDHRGFYACEACHQNPRTLLPLEPHHLVLGTRTDAPDLIMALCADCHRLGPKSAHRSPRTFAVTVVIPWAKAHGYQLPNRKEYRDA